jgi:hypothetical protein
LKKIAPRHLLLVSGMVALSKGCMESPFAPQPFTEDRCGGQDHPCALDCSLDCARVTVDSAAACMLTLEGTLDSSRTQCAFVDGSWVSFSWPLPAQGTDLALRSWSVEIRKAGLLCLAIRSQPLPWVAGGMSSTTEIEGPLGLYRQELSMQHRSPVDRDAGIGLDAEPVIVSDAGDDADTSMSTDDAAVPAPVLPEPRQLTVRCPSDGKWYRGEGKDLCAGCADAGDCRALPLVEVQALWQPSLEMRLKSGGRVTPLFTCQ